MQLRGANRRYDDSRKFFPLQDSFIEGHIEQWKKRKKGRRRMKITTPLTDEIIEQLHSGDNVTITGTIYVGRDAAHKRIIAALDAGEELPFDPRGQIIYYMGPAPNRAIPSAPPGRPRATAWTPTLPA